MVVLLGGLKGPWQERAAKDLDRFAGCVLRTDTPRLSALHLMSYAEVADLIVAWCGSLNDAFYLQEWCWATYVAMKHPGKLVLGIGQNTDHPMAEPLRDLVEHLGMRCGTELETTLATAQERCRYIRRQHG